jgi:hypothetical protein
MVEKGVTGGSCGQYKNHWNKWVRFLQTLPEEERPEEHLRDVEDREDKVMFIIGFIGYLVEELKIRGAKEVSGVISGVKFEWHRRGLESGFFEDSRIKAAKQGARLTTEEMRIAARRSSETRKLPAFVDMIKWLR